MMHSCRRFLTVSLLALMQLLMSGCTPVKPWEKGNLNREIMKFDADPLEANFRRHVYASREAASGGYGVNLSGCGCK